MSKLTQREKKAVVKNIRLHRKRLYSERDGGNRLAKELNVSPQLLSQWSNGTRTPTLEKLIALSEVFNVSIQELCGRPNLPMLDSNISVYDAIIMLVNHVKKRGQGKKVRANMKTVKRLIDNELKNAVTKGKR